MLLRNFVCQGQPRGRVIVAIEIKQAMTPSEQAIGRERWVLGDSPIKQSIAFY
jgi:hypothetical protein